MYYLSKILVRILPWDPWLPRCSKNLARSCQDSQDAGKRVNPGESFEIRRIHSNHILPFFLMKSFSFQIRNKIFCLCQQKSNHVKCV